MGSDCFCIVFTSNGVIYGVMSETIALEIPVIALMIADFVHTVDPDRTADLQCLPSSLLNGDKTVRTERFEILLYAFFGALWVNVQTKV